MPLSEQRRQQLDGIVSQMVANKEKDSDIQFVVNDFKSKYGNETQQQPDGFFKGLAKSIAKPFAEVGTSVFNIGSSVNQLARGNVQQAGQELQKKRNIPFLGLTKPAVTGQEGFLEGIKKQAGYGLQIGSTIAPMGSTGTGVKATLKTMGRFGAANAFGDIGSQITEDKPYNLGQTIASGVIGSAIPLAGKIPSGGKMLKNKIIGETAGDVLNKELQLPKQEIAASIEKGFKSFGEKAAEVVDAQGKPLYVGTYNTLLNKAKNEVIQNGVKLENTLKNYNHVQITRDQVAGDIVSKMQDIYGKLSPAQLKAVKFEVARMPQKMNPLELLGKKRMYDGLIPDNFWTNMDGNASFATQIKYALRDNARKLINESTGDSTIQQLNNRMSIAMDMKKLSASQIAERKMQKNPLSVANFISKVIDDTILNPAITTGISQPSSFIPQKMINSYSNISSVIKPQLPKFSNPLRIGTKSLMQSNSQQ